MNGAPGNRRVAGNSNWVNRNGLRSGFAPLVAAVGFGVGRRLVDDGDWFVRWDRKERKNPTSQKRDVGRPAIVALIFIGFLFRK